MYQVGDYIVKALNGVCKVKAIVHPDFVSERKNYIICLRLWRMRMRICMFRLIVEMRVRVRS